LIILIFKAIKKKALKPTLINLGAIIALTIVFFFLTCLTSCQHQYAEIERKESTCTENGYVKYECSLCGESRTEDIEANGHKMEEIQRIEATSTEDDKIIEVCSACGYEHVTPIEKIADADSYSSSSQLADTNLATSDNSEPPVSEIQEESSSQAVVTEESALAALKVDADRHAIGCAETLVRSNLKDPSSAMFSNEEIIDSDDYLRYIIKLTVSATNSLGSTD